MRIAIVNQKGGVGKTTTSINLAAYLAATGRRVLLVDMDAQGHATKGLGVRLEDDDPTLFDLLKREAEPGDVTHEAAGVHLWPGASDLADLDREYMGKPAGYYLLREALEAHAGGYDTAVIDCPPQLGLATLGALTAATHYLVPVAPGFFSVDGLRGLQDTVGQVSQYTNPGLELLGVVLTRADSRTVLPKETLALLREAFGEKVLRTSIPEAVALAEAPGFGQPIGVYQPRSKAAEAYKTLAGEVAALAG